MGNTWYINCRGRYQQLYLKQSQPTKSTTEVGDDRLLQQFHREFMHQTLFPFQVSNVHQQLPRSAKNLKIFPFQFILDDSIM